MTEAVDSMIDQPVQAGNYQEIFNRQLKHQYVLARTSADERIEKLQRLHDTLLRRRQEIEAALWQDLREKLDGNGNYGSGVRLWRNSPYHTAFAQFAG